MEDASPEMLSIFAGAIERPTPGERAAFLEAACGSDAGLRQRLESLLRAHDEAGRFLRDRSEAGDPVATTDQPPGEGPGYVIGPYKLLEQIGEGGFGVVFLAEQTEPVRRKVALKVLKPGMDTRQVVARFEAERHALAIMDHPNIAKVFDGGATPSGRPYFVMELVKGTPITDFCDQNHLTPRQRLELFVPICQAVQHAHQKGVIHRDLKPSNILVSRHDGPLALCRQLLEPSGDLQLPPRRGQRRVRRRLGLLPEGEYSHPRPGRVGHAGRRGGRGQRLLTWPGRVIHKEKRSVGS
jgi:hypothetical protein